MDKSYAKVESKPTWAQILFPDSYTKTDIYQICKNKQKAEEKESDEIMENKDIPKGIKTDNSGLLSQVYTA